MSSKRTLKGRRVAVLAADGFEKVELTLPLRALRAAGAKVDVVSLRRGRIRGLNLNLPATRARVDRTVEQAAAGATTPSWCPEVSSTRTSSASRRRCAGLSASSSRAGSPSSRFAMGRGCSHQPGSSRAAP